MQLSCRRSCTKKELIAVPTSNRFRINVEEQWKESSKVEALLHHLQTLSEAGSKSVVFSQWTAFLDLLEIPLKRKNFCFVRLDGTLSQPIFRVENVDNRASVRRRTYRSSDSSSNVGAYILRIVGVQAFLGFFAAMADSEGAGDRVASAFDSGSIGDEQALLLLEHLEEEEKVLLHDHSTSQQQDLVGGHLTSNGTKTQSPNDLLGRLWAALPSSSHTLFDGESERKTSARSFGVEVNEMSREVDGGGAAGFALLKRRGSELAASHYL
ncbi:hypothetical protein SELMODRAFT_448891 [Selaginella moellendorffii]|uniref:Helicase C-terminal domain-containing protein n=1 Tax=Selaginella moellendorffii TaxID=88036 RepID=D8TB07_SELML|nr:hypothetical protein SELMODRAFT_448891 [Selaginella moellendorffii]